MVWLVKNDSTEAAEIDFVQLHQDGTLDAFIDDLKELMREQQTAIARYKSRTFLAPIIAGLEGKVDRWRVLVETGKAFKNKFRVSKRK